jgi:group I intron endonuclease
MPYVYTITNIINNKVYVGATTKSPDIRFREHCKDARRFPHRPLYMDINRYGKENFKVAILEQCDEEVLHTREQHWIQTLQSFQCGYNATLGGAGKALANQDIIAKLWEEGKNNKEIHAITSYDCGTIHRALQCHHISEQSLKRRGYQTIQNRVVQMDKKTNAVLQIFDSITDAYRALNKQHSGHIADVCNGKRNTAYGYKWAYADHNT